MMRRVGLGAGQCLRTREPQPLVGFGLGDHGSKWAGANRRAGDRRTSIGNRDLVRIGLLLNADRVSHRTQSAARIGVPPVPDREQRQQRRDRQQPHDDEANGPPRVVSRLLGEEQRYRVQRTPFITPSEAPIFTPATLAGHRWCWAHE